MSRLRTLLGLVAVVVLITAAGCRNRECTSNSVKADSCSGYSCPK